MTKVATREEKVKRIKIIECSQYHPKISYTNVSDKIANANSVGPGQMAPEGAV